jgi:dCMP deaminase
MTPCRTCAMMIINAGIRGVICEKRYHAEKDTLKLFKQSGVELTVMTQEIMKYDNQ